MLNVIQQFGDGTARAHFRAWCVSYRCWSWPSASVRDAEGLHKTLVYDGPEKEARVLLVLGLGLGCVIPGALGWTRMSGSHLQLRTDVNRGRDVGQRPLFPTSYIPKCSCKPIHGWDANALTRWWWWWQVEKVPHLYLYFAIMNQNPSRHFWITFYYVHRKPYIHFIKCLDVCERTFP